MVLVDNDTGHDTCHGRLPFCHIIYQLLILQKKLHFVCLFSFFLLCFCLGREGRIVAEETNYDHSFEVFGSYPCG